MGQGDLFDNESLVKAIKQVDVVISTLGGHMVPHQHKILSAIKQAGNVKVTFIFLTNLIQHFAYNYVIGCGCFDARFILLVEFVCFGNFEH